MPLCCFIIQYVTVDRFLRAFGSLLCFHTVVTDVWLASRALRAFHTLAPLSDGFTRWDLEGPPHPPPYWDPPFTNRHVVLSSSMPYERSL